MNPLKKIGVDLNDDDLTKAIEEIVQWHNTGILSNGILREIAKKVSSGERGSLKRDALRIAEDIVIMEGANRYVKIYKRELVI